MYCLNQVQFITITVTFKLNKQLCVLPRKQTTDEPNTKVVQMYDAQKEHVSLKHASLKEYHTSITQISKYIPSKKVIVQVRL